jgi:hypothetical protein
MITEFDFDFNNPSVVFPYWQLGNKSPQSRQGDPVSIVCPQIQNQAIAQGFNYNK